MRNVKQMNIIKNPIDNFSLILKDQEYMVFTIFTIFVAFVVFFPEMMLKQNCISTKNKY